MTHTYTNCLIHYVFSTKGRRNLLSHDVQKRLHPYLAGIAKQYKMKILAAGGTDNHVHLLVTLPPTLSTAKAIQVIKGNSSKWISDTFPTHANFAWQEGYGAFSIAVSGVESTVAYINNQEEHHRTRTFEEEYISFLKRHGIDYDERQIRN